MLIQIELLDRLKEFGFFVPFFGNFLFLVGQFMMYMNRKPGAKLFDFYIQFFGQKYLTERGIFWRNLSWVGAAASIISLAILHDIVKIVAW